MKHSLREYEAEALLHFKKRTSYKVRFSLARVDKKDALLIFIVFSYFTQNYDMHNNCCQYKRYTASI